MIQCQFQLITGETRANKFLRKTLLVSYGLLGLFLVCALLPAAHTLFLVVAVLWVTLFVSVAVVELSKVKLYQTDGVINLNEASVIFNGLTIQATNLRQVDVKFNSPRGQGAGRSGIGRKGNRIIIHTNTSSETIVATVLIEVRAQRDNLAAVLKEWRKEGVKVSADGIDLF